MKQKTILLLLFFITSCIFTACKKEIITELDLKGTINGHIDYVYDEFINKLSKENVKVEIIGQNISATTDSEGKFSITNVPTGTYDIKFTRNDIADYEYQDIPIVGGNAPIVLKDEISLLNLPTSELSNLSVWQNNGFVYFSIDVTPDTVYHKLIYFIDDNIDVSPASYYKHLTQDLYLAYVDTAFFDRLGSDTIYIKAYEAAYFWKNKSYINRTTGERISYGLNYETCSETVEFIFTN